MGIKFANSAFATLAAGINSSATSITLTTGQGARFPSLGAGDYFYATLIDASNNLEIVKCTARSTDVLTVVRAQEGTTARAFSTGDRIELRVTAQGLVDVSGDLASGVLAIPGTSASGAITRFYEDTDNGTHYVGLKAASSITSSLDFTLPSADGTNGQYLQTNGSGGLSFSTVPTTGRILQIVGLQTSTIAGVASTTATEVSTSYRLNITPQSASSKLYVQYLFTVGGNGSYLENKVSLYRNTTFLVEGNAFCTDYQNNALVFTRGLSFLDTPNTTSAIFYTLRLVTFSGGVTNWINSNNGSTTAGALCAYVMEVAQ